MKIHQSAGATAPQQAAPQIKVRTDLAAGDTCQQQSKYWQSQFNQLNRELKNRGCTF